MTFFNSNHYKKSLQIISMDNMFQRAFEIFLSLANKNATLHEFVQLPLEL